MTLLDRLWLNVEYRMHRVDEYLAAMRGDTVAAMDCASRADECQRRLDVMWVNRRFGHG
jgi:hypothetical protein